MGSGENAVELHRRVGGMDGWGRMDCFYCWGNGVWGCGYCGFAWIRFVLWVIYLFRGAIFIGDEKKIIFGDGFWIFLLLTI